MSGEDTKLFCVSASLFTKIVVAIFCESIYGSLSINILNQILFFSIPGLDVGAEAR